MSTVWKVILYLHATFCLALAVPTIPNIVCPEYFQYVCNGDLCYGKLTLKNIYLQTINLEVQLNQLVPVARGNYGQIKLIQDESNIKTGQSISYHIDFPLANVLPKLTRIIMNDNVICQSEDFEFLPPNSQILILKHYLRLDLQRLYVNSSPISNMYLKSNNLGKPQETNNFQNNPIIQSAAVKPIKIERQVKTESFVYQQDSLTLSHEYQPSTAQSDTTATRIINDNTNAQLLEKLNEQITMARQKSPTQGVIQIATRTQFSPIGAQQQLPNNRIELAKQQCDTQKQNFDNIIKGTATIESGTLPWLAVIFRKDLLDIPFSCDGSLISSRTVITAAQCLHKNSIQPTTAVIFLGWNSLKNSDEVDVQTRSVQDIIIHPEFLKNSRFDADIALLQLNKPVDFNQHIGPICLWSVTKTTTNAGNNNINSNNQLSGEKAIVAGYTTAIKEQPTNLQQIVETNFISNAMCQQAFNSTIAQNIPNTSTLCTKMEENDGSTCLEKNRGSGLLMHNNNQNWDLRGIMSAYIQQGNQENCQAQNSYVIYSDLAKYHQWLLDQMQF